MDNIRNFCIIAHIDHGKSTLADRFLEVTQTVEQRKMQAQYLDQMELERERGITIKMQPVRMLYRLPEDKGKEYTLNLIDTPGHIDFNYEVSRSLQAVEGAILLVDATQGVQAQTIGNLELARNLGLVIIPVLNKIDSPYARTEEVKKEVVEILGCKEEEIMEVSAKTGQGVEDLLKEVVARIPFPSISKDKDNSLRALVFDFEYSPHKGIILYVRIVDGEVRKGDRVFLSQTKTEFSVGETGIFLPMEKPTDSLKSGEIGYIVTNIKEATVASVGDTLLSKGSAQKALPGYKQPSPVVWASIFPQSQDDFMPLKQSLERLKLTDSALVFEEEESGVLGRGFRCGFLGMLHLEIISERLKREYNLELVVATPSVVYTIVTKKGETKKVYSAALLPEFHEITKIMEPWVEISVITPYDKLGSVIQVMEKYAAIIGDTEDFGKERLSVRVQMPLREMMAGFFDDIKSATSGYASFDYEIIGEKEGDLVRLNVLLNDELVPAFAKVVRRQTMEREAKKMAEKLKNIMPRALFAIKIQVKAAGRILSAQKVSALKKDVTGHLYGGDRSRKMKLWQKQKKGKKRMEKHGKVNVPHEVFLKMVQNE